MKKIVVISLGLFALANALTFNTAQAMEWNKIKTAVSARFSGNMPFFSRIGAGITGLGYLAGCYVAGQFLCRYFTELSSPIADSINKESIRRNHNLRMDYLHKLPK